MNEAESIWKNHGDRRVCYLERNVEVKRKQYIWCWWRENSRNVVEKKQLKCGGGSNGETLEMRR